MSYDNELCLILGSITKCDVNEDATTGSSNN